MTKDQIEQVIDALEAQEAHLASMQSTLKSMLDTDRRSDTALAVGASIRAQKLSAEALAVLRGALLEVTS